jgi:hypothetical protein
MDGNATNSTLDDTRSVSGKRREAHMADHIFTASITEQPVPGRRLGRHIVHDERSRAFPAPRADAVKSVTHQATGLPLDQGDVGSCTANALCGAPNSAPDFKGGQPPIKSDAVNLYEVDTRLEGKPYPPNDPGGSGLLVWFWNSGGTKYGAEGRFCMSFDTWEQLLTQRGDVTVPSR